MCSLIKQVQGNILTNMTKHKETIVHERFRQKLSLSARRQIDNKYIQKKKEAKNHSLIVNAPTLARRSCRCTSVHSFSSVLTFALSSIHSFSSVLTFALSSVHSFSSVLTFALSSVESFTSVLTFALLSHVTFSKCTITSCHCCNRESSLTPAHLPE